MKNNRDKALKIFIIFPMGIICPFSTQVMTVVLRMYKLVSYLQNGCFWVCMRSLVYCVTPLWSIQTRRIKNLPDGIRLIVSFRAPERGPGPRGGRRGGARPPPSCAPAARPRGPRPSVRPCVREGSCRGDRWKKPDTSFEMFLLSTFIVTQLSKTKMNSFIKLNWFILLLPIVMSSSIITLFATVKNILGGLEQKINEQSQIFK